jgi:Protein of unknown function (DUF2934)
MSMATAAAVERQYRLAFEEFSRKAQRVQSLAENPDGDQRAFEAALVDLEKAHLAYDYARDALVRAMLPAPQQQARLSHREHVPAIAELLWESAGRPTGTAEEDWRRAEAIVETAFAATACC